MVGVVAWSWCLMLRCLGCVGEICATCSKLAELFPTVHLSQTQWTSIYLRHCVPGRGGQDRQRPWHPPAQRRRRRGCAAGVFACVFVLVFVCRLCLYVCPYVCLFVYLYFCSLTCLYDCIRLTRSASTPGHVEIARRYHGECSRKEFAQVEGGQRGGGHNQHTLCGQWSLQRHGPHHQPQEA